MADPTGDDVIALSEAQSLVERAQRLVVRAAAFQQEADAAGYGRPAAQAVVFHRVGMSATVSLEVAVVRQDNPRRRCEQCGHRRVLFALTFTTSPVDNPEHPWRCAPCWGLR